MHPLRFLGGEKPLPLEPGDHPLALLDGGVSVRLPERPVVRPRSLGWLDRSAVGSELLLPKILRLDLWLQLGSWQTLPTEQVSLGLRCVFKISSFAFM